MDMSKAVGQFSAVFGRGVGRMGQLMFLVGFLTFAKVWETFYNQYGIVLWEVAIGLPILVIVCSLIVGYLDFKYEIQKHENLYNSKQAGWDYEEVLKSIKNIEDKLERCNDEGN